MKTKNNKSKQGFTLVEVIVVAVIVAVLAAVAIPIYQTYVEDSKDNSAKNAGGSFASFQGACAANSGYLSATGTITGPDQVTCTNPDGRTTAIEVPEKVSLTGVGTATITSTHTDRTATYDFNTSAITATAP
jgi:prepilin-type N-terminal cleavage/methylation domain-containing protein